MMKQSGELQGLMEVGRGRHLCVSLVTLHPLIFYGFDICFCSFMVIVKEMGEVQIVLLLFEHCLLLVVSQSLGDFQGQGQH